MENAVSGEEITQRTFPARPTLCHKRNISRLKKNNNNSAGVGMGCDRCSPWPCAILQPANRRGDRTAIPGVSPKPARNLIRKAPPPAPQSPGTRMLPRGSLSSLPLLSSSPLYPRCLGFSFSSFPSFTLPCLLLVYSSLFQMISMPFQNTGSHF